MRLKPTFACYILLLACSVPRVAQCQEIDGVYRGTLGKQEIVVGIGIDPEHKDGQYLVGQYFYRRHGVGIPIKGAHTADGSFLLNENSGDETAPSQWKLKFQENGAFGSFCKCDLKNAPQGQAKLLPISLKKISSEFDPNFDLPSPQAYSDLLLDFPLTTSSEVTTKSGYAYTMVTDSRFKTSMPQITKFPDASVIMKINSQLQNELKELRLGAANCLQGGDVNDKNFDTSTTVELFSPHLMSVVRDEAYYCGGPHPDESVRVNTYDLDSGTETSVEELLAREIDPEAYKKLVKDSEIPGKEAASRLAAELYLQYYDPDKAQCGDVFGRDETGAPDLTTIQFLSEKELVIIPDLPHVVESCANPALVPYDKLRPLLKTNSQFLVLVGADH